MKRPVAHLSQFGQPPTPVTGPRDIPRVLRRPVEHVCRQARRRQAYELLQLWLAEHDDVYPSSAAATTSHEYVLFRFIDNQRLAHRAGRLHADRQRALELLPGWAWNSYDNLWHRNYQALASWLDTHAGADPARESLDGEEKRIAKWMKHQRQRRAGQ